MDDLYGDYSDLYDDDDPDDEAERAMMYDNATLWPQYAPEGVYMNDWPLWYCAVRLSGTVWDDDARGYVRKVWTEETFVRSPSPDGCRATLSRGYGLEGWAIMDFTQVFVPESSEVPGALEVRHLRCSPGGDWDHRHPDGTCWDSSGGGCEFGFIDASLRSFGTVQS